MVYKRSNAPPNHKVYLVSSKALSFAKVMKQKILGDATSQTTPILGQNIHNFANRLQKQDRVSGQ